MRRRREGLSLGPGNAAPELGVAFALASVTLPVVVSSSLRCSYRFWWTVPQCHLVFSDFIKSSVFKGFSGSVVFLISNKAFQAHSSCVDESQDDSGYPVVACSTFFPIKP